MIDFVKLVAKNFVTYENFSIELKNRGVLNIRGKNGSGKSLIGDMITWCLFGEVIRGSLADEIIGKFKNETNVYLTLNDDKEEYVIYRGRGEEWIKLEINGKSKATINETQKQINELLGCNFLLFRNAVIFGQNDNKIFTELNDHSKKELFEHLFPEFEKFKIGERNLKDEYKIFNDKLNIAKTNLENFNNELTSAKEEYNEMLKEIKILHREDIKKYNESLKTIKDEISKNNSTINKLKIKLKSNNAKRLNKKHKIFLKKYNIYRDEIALYERKLSIINEKLYKVNATKGKKQCDYCGSLINIDNIFEYKNNLNDKRKNLNGKIVKKNILRNNLDKKLKEIEGKLELIIITRDNILELENCIETLNKKFITLKKPEKKNLFKIILKKKKRIKEIKNDINKNKIIVNAINKRIERNGFFKVAFSDKGIKSMILEDIAPRLTEYANNHSKILTNGKQYLEFTNKTKLKSKVVDKIDIIVNDEEGEKNLRVLSGGQKKTANLSVMFAFGDLLNSRINKRINFRFYDEPFEALDDVNKENVVELVNDFAEKYGTVLVISHDKDICESFENYIMIEKKDNRSICYG